MSTIEFRMNDAFDLLILGGGSASLSAARTAKAMGKTVAIVEDRGLGGACPNWGCVPSKFLIEAARAYHAATHPRYPGIPAAMATIDFAKLIAAKDEFISGGQKNREKRRQDYHVESGHAEFIDAHTLRVACDDGVERTLAGKKILIATGAKPTLPKIDGLDRVPFITSDWLEVGGAADWDRVPTSLLIIGGGYIAVELGQMFQRLGSRVTLLEQSSQLLREGYEPEVGKTVIESLRREGMTIDVDAKAERIETTTPGITAIGTLAGLPHRWTAERLMIAAGREPNTQTLRLERAGVQVDDRGAIVVDPFMQTNVAHIYAAGDVIGGQQHSQMATPVANDEGTLAAKNALGNDRRPIDLTVAPRAIFIEPEVAMVGLTEAEARQRDTACWSTNVPMTDVARAHLLQQTDGFLKMIADAVTGNLLGVTMVGAAAGEVIHEAAMALCMQATVHDVAGLIHVFPTMAEALKIAAKRFPK